MSLHFIEHITQDGDRWDLLAALYRGDPFDYEPILLANRQIAPTPELEGGLAVRIPVVTTPLYSSDPGLPPWHHQKTKDIIKESLKK